jgi:hypothetical protein
MLDNGHCLLVPPSNAFNIASTSLLLQSRSVIQKGRNLVASSL